MNWREQYKDKLLTVQEAALKVTPEAVIHISMSAGIPYLLLDALAERGIPLTVYGGLFIAPTRAYQPPIGSRIAVNNFILGPIDRAVARGGARVSYQAMHLSDTGLDRGSIHKPDVVLLAAAPPDKKGLLSQGLCPYAVDRIPDGTKIIVQINENMPFIPGVDTMLPLARADWIVDAPSQVPTIPVSPPSKLEEQIAFHIVERVRNGSCIQLGIGRLGTAVGAFLRCKRDLGIHSEMFTQSMMELIRCGAVNNSKKHIQPGKSVFAFSAGTQELYDFLNCNNDVESRPFSYVNDPRIIAQNDNVVSINAALEVDLTGQVCAESIGSQQYSGTGGQLDFVRGAHWSRGGQSFIALASSRLDQMGQRHSRINLSLSPGAAVTTPRADVQYIVTEYGIADLLAQPLDQRAKRLIAIAHPDFRDELTYRAKKAGLIL